MLRKSFREGIGVRSRRGEAFGRQIINFMKRLFSECFARTGVRSQEEIGKFLCHLLKSQKMHTFYGIPFKTLALISVFISL
ncbi:MAG: hypothetical protein ACKPBB_06685 [Sphaerospermopsis kisseleviana]